jgi:hypothetical protein
MQFNKEAIIAFVKRTDVQYWAAVCFMGMWIVFLVFLLLNRQPDVRVKEAQINEASGVSAVEAVRDADEEIARSAGVARKVESDIVRGSVRKADDGDSGDAARVRRSYDAWRSGIERLRAEDDRDQGS